MRWTPSGAAAGLLTVLAVTNAAAKETTAPSEAGHTASDSSSWKESDLKCSPAGETRFRCATTCGGENGTCSVETVMERCTCDGAAVKMNDNAYYNADSGQRITAVGFQDVASLCESCQSHCRKPGTAGQKSTDNATTESSWQTKSIPCEGGSKSGSKDVEKPGQVGPKEVPENGTAAKAEGGTNRQKATTKGSEKTTRGESGQESTEKHSADENVVNGGLANRNGPKSDFSGVTSSVRKETYVAVDEGESVVESGGKKTSPSKSNKTRSRRSTKIRDWTRDVAEEIELQLEAERVEEGSSDYANEDDNRVELGIPQMLQQGGKRPDEDKSKTVNPPQEKNPSIITSKVTGSRSLVGASQDGTANSGAVSFDKKLQQDTSFVAPQVSTSDIARCDHRGNESRTCTEDCAEDGATCVMRVALQRCTCSGIKVNVVEVQKFDLRSKLSVFLAAPNSARYGSGYVRECGSCVDYCQLWPGESHSYEVATAVLSCGAAKPA